MVGWQVLRGAVVAGQGSASPAPVHLICTSSSILVFPVLDRVTPSLMQCYPVGCRVTNKAAMDRCAIWFCGRNTAMASRRILQGGCTKGSGARDTGVQGSERGTKEP